MKALSENVFCIDNTCTLQELHMDVKLVKIKRLAIEQECYGVGNGSEWDSRNEHANDLRVKIGNLPEKNCRMEVGSNGRLHKYTFGNVWQPWPL